MPAAIDEGEDLGDRRVLAGERAYRGETLGEHARTVEQLLIKAAYRGKPLAGELAALHADDVEAFEHGILAIDEAVRNDVAAHAADAADHHAMADPGELMHRGQAADIDGIAD